MNHATRIKGVAVSVRRRRIGSSLLVVWAATFLVVTILVVVTISVSLHSLARSEARDKAEIIVARSLATHSYFSNDLKPHVFKLSEQIKGRDYFDPVWMSSTYAIRGIQQYFGELVSANYYYKECAINPRSPLNEADAVEADFLKRINADTTLVKESLVRTFDGEPYIVVMQRAEQMVDSCMPCHSDPSLAPKELVDQYGPVRSFGRTIGEYPSAISVRIPLAQAYAAAKTTTNRLSLALMAIFGVSLGGVYRHSRRVVFVPARQYEAQNVALTEAVDRERAVNQEITAMNEELSAGNEQLASEVKMRESVEDELERYKNSLEELVSSRTTDLERAMSEAERANAAKSLFLANMSHDLRTPLNSVIGFSDVLVSGMAGDLNEEQLKQIRMINDSGKYLLALVSDLLDLSRIESAAEPVELSDFDLTGTLTAVVDSVRPLCAEKGLRFRCDTCDARVLMHSDERLIRQLLLNLLGNAIKFTSEGEVTLRVVEHERSGDVVMEVADSGMGIARDELPYVFEAFRQFSDDRSAKPDGAGLGLAISLKIARLLGGTITAASNPGKGSIFTVRLPRVAPPADEDSNTPL